MNVELLVVPDCLQEAAARQLLRTALDDVGLGEVDFATGVIDTQLLADKRGLTGSPTILIDGSDPFAEPAQPPSLACRIYRHRHGTAGIPELPALRQALKQAATHDGREHPAAEGG